MSDLVNLVKVLFDVSVRLKLRIGCSSLTINRHTRLSSFDFLKMVFDPQIIIPKPILLRLIALCYHISQNAKTETPLDEILL